LNNTLWQRFLYLWLSLIGWALFILTQLLQSNIIFWIGALGGIAFGLAAIFTSAAYIAKGPKDTLVHGITWTLAVSLGFLSFIFIYAVLSGA
jgi:hypothetical protein